MEFLEEYKGKKTAVYGLSTETEKVLPELSGQFKVIGLLDGFKSDGEMFGFPIIPMDKAVSEGVELIVVVARPGSCKAIAKRIGDKCRENKIALFDIRGKDLLQTNKVVYDFKAVKGYKYADVIERIMSADAVSFDLFDTLVMRTVLSSADVLDIVSARMEERHIEVKDFVNKRLAAEKELSQGYAPKLIEIYEKVADGVAGVSTRELSALEYEVEKTLLVARKDTVRLLRDARKLGKKVYITTDTYYDHEQIVEILAQNGIYEYDAVLVSCEYKTGKTQSLFTELKKKAGTGNIIHIGDDIVADIQSAERNDIKTFQLYSASELLDLVGGLGLADAAEQLSDRIKLGMFIADIFNSPFQFEDEDRKIKVKDAFSIGYLFCAPMINDFVVWFGQQVRNREIQNIWFCARDGYVIQKLFAEYYPGMKSDYFLTSRTAAIRAGVEAEADIAYVNSMKFSGEVEDNLLKRFGLVAADLKEPDIDDTKEGLLKYKEAILNAAAVKKANNQKYIDSLNVKEGAIAFFDFVAKGTSQMYAGRLIQNKIIGLYFLQLEPEYMKDKNLDIEPFYTEAEREGSAIFDNYYILETILTSPQASVAEFDEAGEPIYAEETRSQKDIDCFMRAQAGILAYAKKYVGICPRSKCEINKKLDEAFLTLVRNVEISDKDFLALTVEDPFYNRMTEITDVL